MTRRVPWQWWSTRADVEHAGLQLVRIIAGDL
jgi:hypothetical protein